LELIAYYNEAEPLDEEWTEERWYRAGVVAKERPRNTWKYELNILACFSSILNFHIYSGRTGLPRTYLRNWTLQMPRHTVR